MSRTHDERASEDPEEPYLVKPVHKALQVLAFVAETEREVSLSELCAAMALPKSTAFRYLRTLAADGFLRHDPATDRYGLGTRLWELGQRARGRRSVRDAARPVMEELRDLFDETINLAILDGVEVVYVDMFESRRGLRMQTTLGGRDPAYSTALGKAILAHLPREEVRAHVPARLEPRTSRTVATLAALTRELDVTRARGYALDDGENDDGVCCFGAAVLDGTGRPVAALSLSAPASRLGAELKREIASAVADRAMALSRRLGWIPALQGAAEVGER